MAIEKRVWLYDLLLIAVLAVGAYFRVIGLNWDEDQHLHPDERFLTMVESNLQVRKCLTPDIPMEACPPEQKRWLGLGDYFDTTTSPLNPHNRGFGFFVYGTLPIFIVRYLAEWLGQTGYDQVHLVGRQLSALADLGTVLLIYVIAARLYNRRAALLAAAFSALAVLQIQQSHFFTVDTVANLFIFLAIYFAVEIASGRDLGIGDRHPTGVSSPEPRITVPALLRDPLFRLSLGFGIALGMAVASKLNAAPLAVLLPGALTIRAIQNPLEQRRWVTTDQWLPLIYLAAGGIMSLLMFRIFQPYAFIGLRLNPAWVANIKELAGQSSGDVDVPFALQWARRSHLYSFQNLTVWGLGLPLGLLAWTGFLWMGWRALKGESRHLLLWGWTGSYFLWQSLAFNPTMRYQLPIYPLLAMMAAWALFEIGKLKRLAPLAFALGGLVLILMAAWAFAFTRIYTRPVTRVAAARWIYQNVPGPINLHIQTTGSTYRQPLPFPSGESIQSATPYLISFTANATGTLDEIYFPHVTALGAPASQTFSLSLLLQPDSPPDQVLARAAVTSDFPTVTDSRGGGYTLALGRPLAVTQGQTYFLRLETTGALTLAGAAPINESSWDDGLPLRIDGYDGFGGLYQGGLNFEMYLDDNADKLARFTSTLDQGDYIFMSSNRQWASITRVPERYPLTSVYYRALIGCPADKDIIWCYNVARPGMFEGQLGYKLVAVFESFPTLDLPVLGKWEFNDQFAEEAFTVYDHPKVLIFQKSADYNPAQIRAILGAVDLSGVVHLTPEQAGNYKDLMLPADRLAAQQAGGTWSQLFNYNWLQNRFPALGLALWYLFIFVLGAVTYPIVRLVLPGLSDRGYPLARTLGLVLLAYLPWLGGSFGLPYTRLTIGVLFGLVAAAGLGLGWAQRDEIRAELKTRGKYVLLVEGLFLAFFVFDLLIRLGNPDLWHPDKGGERPMDFSYFNAVLKSTTFPPYDPWFAGGYINYYYYGYVLVGTPVKLLGIVPSIAYNLILPTLFAMVALSAFSIGWNLLEDRKPATVNLQLITGILAALLMVVFGNLGTVRMLFQGFQRMAAPGGIIDNANVVQRWVWAAQGLAHSILGQALPFGRGEWYWNPSRVIPAPGDVEPITEFPFFTFLYSDLHAHMIALPLALLALSWVLSVVLARAKWRDTPSAALGFLVGGLVIGALYPTNLSDIYTYLPIGFAALGYAIWRYADLARTHWLPGLPLTAKRLILIGVSVLALTALSFWLYEPYRMWYAQAYSKIDPWRGTHTPIWSYLTHWGVFLFFIAAWMTWETREWMASTPLSALNKLRPYQILIEAAIAVVAVLLLYLAFRGAQVGWLALSLAVWAAILILRPGLADAKRLVLFWIATALLITVMVEVIVVRGDIGRMNTVFKFYLQAWTLLALSAAAAFGWILPEVPRWLSRWRNFFQAGATLLLAGAFLFTVSASMAKIADRMAPDAPRTLDSMTYMAYARYWDAATMDLSQDYHAIRWMQDNVVGSPVIVEGNTTEYKWGSRFTIYTGLPGVVGWNWHQRQQRALVPPDLITDRIDEIRDFYTTTDIQAARAFLKKYNVKYIVVGQLERAYYPGGGLNKFEQYNGKLWNSVFRTGDTVIYQVNP